MLLAGAASAEGVSVSDAYIRGLPPGQTVTAAFMTLKNSSGRDCRLIGASSPIASSAEIHAHSHHNGKMSMRPVESVAIPCGESVPFKPGGYHLMLFGLQHTLVAGDEHNLTLLFEDCPEINVTVPVRSVLNEGGH